MANSPHTGATGAPACPPRSTPAAPIASSAESSFLRAALRSGTNKGLMVFGREHTRETLTRSHATNILVGSPTPPWATGVVFDTHGVIPSFSFQRGSRCRGRIPLTSAVDGSLARRPTCLGWRSARSCCSRHRSQNQAGVIYAVSGRRQSGGHVNQNSASPVHFAIPSPTRIPSGQGLTVAPTPARRRVHQSLEDASGPFSSAEAT